MSFVYDDGGRQAAGFEGPAGDCVCRAVSIASGRSYGEVRERLNLLGGTSRVRHSKRRASAENGLVTSRPWFALYMVELGFRWHAGDGDTSAGRFVVSIPCHAFAIIDGVVHDTHEVGLRRQYYGVVGYWHRD